MTHLRELACTGDRLGAERRGFVNGLFGDHTATVAGARAAQQAGQPADFADLPAFEPALG